MSDEKMTVIERLETLLNDKDFELSNLRRDLEEREARDEYDESWAWMRHSKTKADPLPDLPVPRLEIRWIDVDDYTSIAEYVLVYRFFLGEYIRIPISKTKQTGSGSVARGHVVDGKVETPFRDGSHIRHDMRHLNLPGYAVAGSVVTKLEPLDGTNPYDEPTRRSTQLPSEGQTKGDGR